MTINEELDSPAVTPLARAIKIHHGACRAVRVPEDLLEFCNTFNRSGGVRFEDRRLLTMRAYTDGADILLTWKRSNTNWSREGHSADERGHLHLKSGDWLVVQEDGRPEYYPDFAFKNHFETSAA